MTHISVWSFQRKSYDVTDTIYSIIAMDILSIAHTKKRHLTNLEKQQQQHQPNHMSKEPKTKANEMPFPFEHFTMS